MTRTDRTVPLVRLDDPAATERTQTGGKGANLAKLVEAGLPVPDGVCVTTAVYDRLVDDPDIVSRIEELENSVADDELRRLGAELRDRIRARPIPREVRNALDDYLDPQETYVVRSSATAEDLPTASFAGQHETVLDVSGLEDVLEAVSECVASLFTDRAISYRVNNDVPHSDVAMSVVVQRMVDADVSGVLFTADPLTGSRTIASIDAVSGLGEALVSGTVTGDNARVDRETRAILEYRTGESASPASDAPSSSSSDAPDSSSSNASGRKRVLTDDQVMTLVSYGEGIEDEFDAPQDIEWSIVGDQVWILQSRPITSLFPVPSPAPEDDGLHVYYSYSHRQGMIDPMPPLSVDYVRRYTSWTLRNLFAYDPSTFSPVVGAGGLVYMDVTPLLRSKRLAPNWLAGIAELDEPAVPLQKAVVKHRGDEFSAASAIGERSVRTYLATAGTFVRIAGVGIARTIQGFLKRDYTRFPERERAWYEQYSERAVARIRAGETEAERIRLAMDETSTFGWVATRAFVTNAGFLSKRILRRLCPDRDAEFEAIDKGMRDNVTITMVLELGDLADVARDHPAVAEAILSGKPFDEIRRVDGSEEFVTGFERFLEVYGHRASAELDPSQPRYREDPSTLLGTVRSKLTTGEEGDHREKIHRLEADAEAAIVELERAADRGLFGPIRRRLVRPLASRYRSYKATRETPKYGYARLWSEFRRQVLSAGERLEHEGRIETVDDVWLFRLEELLSALENPEKPIEVDLDARRSDYLLHRGLRGPRVITSDGAIPRGEKLAGSDDGGFAGVATSNGVAEGNARVVYDPRTETIEEGEILIAPYTDPGWTPLFLNAAGLITDVGGVFSHGSLVAREYGIPSVVVDDATRTFETGQRLRVDGNNGVVEVLEDEP